MRWNCPHCEELVAADIDFENTKKAYVRCAKCGGMALVHRSAVLADSMKARRLEEEARLEADLRLAQTAAANARAKAMEAEVRGLNERLIQGDLPASAPPPLFRNAEPPLSAAVVGTVPAPTIVPPPFRLAPATDVAAAPPSFAYANPPAFLLKPTAIEAAEYAFAIDDEAMAGDRMDAIEASTTGVPDALAGDAATSNPSPIRPTITLWIAAAIALASGAYLYREGKKAFAPTSGANPPAQADTIRSKANSAIRPDARTLVIVRVPRAVVRSGPSPSAAAVQTLDRASTATLLDEKDGWTRIGSPKIASADRTAWIRADLVTRLPE